MTNSNGTTGSSTDPESFKTQPTNMNDSQRIRSAALGGTLAGAAHLTNFLPTGTLLVFQVLCPLVSSSGHCDHVRRIMTATLLGGCALSGFFASFTDSYRGIDKKVHYGVATPKGLWKFEDVEPAEGQPEGNTYKLVPLDFVHAILSLLVFMAVALYDKDVFGCFFSTSSEETKEILNVVPVGIGFICSLLFLLFPTKRHGIGFPLSN